VNPVAWISRYLPNWSIVMGAAGLVGAVAAIVAVAVYRDVLEDSGSAVPVKSEVPDG
jgi:hypothetical protein